MLATPILDRLAESGSPTLEGVVGNVRAGARTAAVAGVARELTYLLNCHGLESQVDLAAFPDVARSVLNYGMPSLAGVAASSVNSQSIAERIRQAVATFEPRLREVRITPVPVDGPSAEIRFRIHGLLLLPGDPTPVELETQIALGDGNVSVGSAGAG